MNSIKTELQAFYKKIISIDEAIKIISANTQSSINEAAQWLIMKKIINGDEHIQLHRFNFKKFETSPIKPHSGSASDVALMLDIYAENGSFFIEDSCFSQEECHKYGWYRSEFDAFMQKNLSDWTSTPKEERSTSRTSDQLALLFDTTRPEHAPDLAMAVRLWLELYGGEQRTKLSHSAASDHFFRRNPSATTAKDRIKEVCSPQSIWKASRKDAYQQAIDDFTAQQQNKK